MIYAGDGIHREKKKKLIGLPEEEEEEQQHPALGFDGITTVIHHPLFKLQRRIDA